MQARVFRFLIPWLVLGILFSLAVPSSAATIPLQETDLYPGSSAAAIHQAGDGRLYILDNQTELWLVNPQDGTFLDYYPLGGDNLADIAFASNTLLWWTDNTTQFGTLDVQQQKIAYYSLNITRDYGGEIFNLGPVTVFNSQPWFATWYGAKYGLFQFDGTNFCLYAFPGGLYAADLASLGNRLWVLNWSSEKLLSLDPVSGQLISFTPGKDLGLHAQLISDGSRLWWATDSDNGAIQSFDPLSSQLVTYTLPAGVHPMNLFVQGGNLWFTDSAGSIHQLNLALAGKTQETLTPQVAAESLSPNCKQPDAPSPGDANFTSGAFTWSGATGNLSQPQTGLSSFSMPETASPFGISLASGKIWVSDPGRQKLIRLDIPPEHQIFLPLIRR